MGRNLHLTSSIEKISLVRKFAVTFFLMSILPCAVVFYLVQHYLDNTVVDEYILLILLSLMALGTVGGFYIMRRSIVKIHQITSQATQILSKNIPSLGRRIESDESEVTQLVKTFNEVTKNLETNIKRLESSKQTMQYVLSKLALGISSAHTIDTFLELIVEITARALDAQSGVLLLLDGEKNELYVKAVSGFEGNPQEIRLKMGEEAPGWAAKNKKALLIPRSREKETSEKGLFVPPLLYAPMLYQDRLVGVLGVSGKLSGGNFAEDELLIITNLASQTAIAVENERLHLDAERTYIETVSALAMAVEARDPYSRGHSDRVSQYSVKIAQKLGLQPELIQDIKTAGELHDVGKIGITDDILKKPGPLSEEEWQIMRKHPVIGEGIIKPVRSLSRLCAIIRHHHEWVDGTGYPDRLKGDQIPLGAKILAVADSLDAMISDRPYRKALNIELAKVDLMRYIDIRYEGRLVEALLSVI